MAKKNRISTDAPQPLVAEKVKKLRKRTVKKPVLTKLQRPVMKILNANGYAQLMKTMDDKIRFKVCDVDANPKIFAHTKSINALLRKKLIYKAVDGKYYSTKESETNETKPTPISSDDINQGQLFVSPKSDSKNSV